MNKKILNKNGISIAEVVIAMAVVTIVTVTSLSIVFTSTRSTQKAAYTTAAQYFAADAVECFRAAKDAEQFETAMTFRGGYTLCEPSAVDPEKESQYQYTYQLADSGYSAVVTLNYPDKERPSFTVAVTDHEGRVVAQHFFLKGDS